MSVSRYAMQHCAAEWFYTSGRTCADPFNEVELDVLFRGPQGQEWLVPAYWAGGPEWRVRFAPPLAGHYTCETRCSDPTDPGLHGQRGELFVGPYSGRNPLLAHGPLRLNTTRTALEHQDSTAFFWLGDIWWYGMSRRLRWPEEFQRLVADRAAKGFSVIQIVAAFSCDAPPYDERGANEAGQPWEPDYARINPAYFDMADLRVQWLVHQGLVPSLVGCWGFYLPWMGVDKVKRHWRYLVARYGAYPVIWCLAGCGTMPYYRSEHREEEALLQKHGWTEVARYVRALDPYHHPLTMHPARVGRDEFDDDAVIDLNMLQSGFAGMALPRMLERIQAELARQPHMPVLNGETTFEGRMGGNYQDVQRLMFWTALCSGLMGHNYCAEGLWQVERADDPFGGAPGHAPASDITWEQAAAQPGSAQLGIGRRLLARYNLGVLEPHQEWVEPHATPQDHRKPYAGGIPGQLRVLYFPFPVSSWGPPVQVQGLEPGLTYDAYYLDPRNGQEHPLGLVSGPDPWRVPHSPRMHDWVLVLARLAE
jgi:hypothetical protein